MICSHMYISQITGHSCNKITSIQILHVSSCCSYESAICNAIQGRKKGYFLVSEQLWLFAIQHRTCAEYLTYLYNSMAGPACTLSSVKHIHRYIDKYFEKSCNAFLCQILKNPYKFLLLKPLLEGLLIFLG